MRFIYTKTFAAFCVCLVIVAILVFLDSRGYSDPLRKAFLDAPRPVIYVAQKITQPIKSFFGSIYTLRSISRENVTLEAKVITLEQQLVLLDQYKLENDALKKEIGFVRTSQLHLQPCTVLSSDPEGIADTLVLSCGSNDGIVAGQAVISQGYLVGRITLVQSASSTMLLITNAKSSVDGKISRSNTEGVVRGSFSSGLVLELVSQNADIKSGDIVVTAGINSMIPKNLMIGEVGDQLSGQNDLFKRNSIVSPIRFHDLDYVFVAK